MTTGRGLSAGRLLAAGLRRWPRRAVSYRCRTRIRLAGSLLAGFLLASCENGIAPPPLSLPTTDRIVFQRVGADSLGHVYSMLFDGSDLRRLTSSLFDERCPSISPDGNWIAYYVFFSGGPTALWLMRANGEQQHRIATIGPPSQCPVWSRSNDLVEVTTYASSSTGGFEQNWTLQVFDLAGNEVGHHDETSFSLFEFSADAQEFLVSYMSCSVNGCMDPDLAVITRNGSFERWLTSGVQNGIFVHEGAKEASISPDGLTVVYVCKPDSDQDPYSGFPIRAACTKPWDGSSSRFLLTDLNSPQWPEFSPDGTRIAFICSQGAQNGICLIASDGSNLTMVPTPPADGAPSWTADGTRVIFTCQVRDICAVDIRTASFANLTNGVGTNANPSVSMTS